MNSTINRVLEITFVAAIVFIILTHAGGFATVAGATAGAYSTATKALYGVG